MICFFSENGHKGLINRSANYLRTEFAWQAALAATHEPLHALTDDVYDAGVLIIPKKLGLDIDKVRSKCKKLYIMQEGPHDYFQNYGAEAQALFLKCMDAADVLLCHNEYDKKYYEGLWDKPVYVNKTLLLEDSVAHIDIVPRNQRDGVMIGGTFCQWYSGFDSYKVAKTLSKSVSAPKMGKYQEGEENLNDISYLPFEMLNQFLETLSVFEYGVHLMRPAAAGTFALNCARLGIPCIGYNHIDTQRKLFPKLSVDYGDVRAAMEVAHKLKTKQGFYEYIVKVALQAYVEHYSEESYMKQEWINEISS